jgi:hypothetical protein
MKGIILSDPQLIDNGKRIAFDFLREDTKETISCISGIQFVKPDFIGKNKQVVLNGSWSKDPTSGRLVSFIFDSIVQIKEDSN